MEARTAACRALAALAQNNNHVDVIGNSHVLRTLREMLGSRSSLWARRTAAATLAALARRQHVRRPIVENNMVPLLVLLLKDTQVSVCVGGGDGKVRENMYAMGCMMFPVYVYIIHIQG